MALGLAVILAIGIGWFAASQLGGSGGSPPTTPLAAGSPETSSPAPSTLPSTSAPPTAVSDPAVAPPSATTEVPPPAPPPPPPPGPPGPCLDDAIGLTAETGLPEYAVGQRPVLRLVITNISPVACIRDVDPALQELLVFSGDGVTRLWSSNDCATGGGPDVRTLQPGQQVRSELTWGGRSSQAGCPEPRTTIPAGDYQVFAKLGPITSPPAPLRLLP